MKLLQNDIVVKPGRRGGGSGAGGGGSGSRMDHDQPPSAIAVD